MFNTSINIRFNKLLLFTWLVSIALPFSGETASLSDIQFQEIRFFESGERLLDEDERKYATEFSQKDTRRINTELNVQNNLFQKGDQQHSVSWRYYSPDGNLFGIMDSEFNIKKEWEVAWTFVNWGWDSPGNWQPGTYKVEVWVNNIKFAEKSFTIVEDMGLTIVEDPDMHDHMDHHKDHMTHDQPITKGTLFPPENPQIEFRALNFFESGKGIPDYDNRNYGNKFSQSEARYLNFEVVVNNLAHNIKDNKYLFRWKYYDPDGKVIYESERDYSFPKEYTLPDFAEGWGWADAGYWKVGTYRVEVYVENMLFAEKEFTIVDDRLDVASELYYPDSKNPMVEFNFLKIFSMNPTDTDPPAAPSERFAQDELKYIYAQFSVRNHLYEIRDQSYEINFKYYFEDGSLFTERKHTFTVKKDWETAWYYTSWGWNVPGRWPPGTHKVEIWIEGMKMAEKPFTVE